MKRNFAQHSFALLSLAVCAGQAVCDDWRQVVPAPGAPMEYGPMRPLALSNAAPEDVKIEFPAQGTRRFTELRLGPPSSIRMVVLLEERPTGAELFLDANRDRVVEASETVARSGKLWRAAVKVASAPKGCEPRTVVFRRRTDGGLSFALAGYVEGPLSLDGKPTTVRRRDADGNGSFTDPRDELWVDLDRNGAFDPFTEQFNYGPLLTIGGRRVALAGEPFAYRMELRPVVGTGRVAFVPRWLKSDRNPVDLLLSLGSEDGVAAAVESTGVADAPVGVYRPRVLQVKLGPPEAEQWTFMFSAYDERAKGAFDVKPNSVATVDPVGKLDFGFHLHDFKGKLKPGQEIVIRPYLYTGDGLLITSAERGNGSYSSGSPVAKVQLVTSSGDPLHTAHSGFA